MDETAENLELKRKQRMLKTLALLFLCLLLGAALSWIACCHYFNNVIHDIENAKIILVSKQEMKLRVVDYKGNELFVADIACGRNYGNKQKWGDMKTPEGVFSVSDIQDASSWTHDFGDGKGKIEGAYGPWFIRLSVPGHKGIGIHGTHDPFSIGTRVTEGCIRLKNEDLEELVPMVEVPMVVVITPSVEDAKNN